VDALVLRHDCFKIDGDSREYALYCQRQSCSARSVVSGDIRLMSVFGISTCPRPIARNQRPWVRLIGYSSGFAGEVVSDESALHTSKMRVLSFISIAISSVISMKFPLALRFSYTVARLLLVLVSCVRLKL